MLKLLDTKTLVFELKLNNWAHHSNQLHYEDPISVVGYEYANALEKVLTYNVLSIVFYIDNLWFILKLFGTKTVVLAAFFALFTSIISCLVHKICLNLKPFNWFIWYSPNKDDEVNLKHWCVETTEACDETDRAFVL